MCVITLGIVFKYFNSLSVLIVNFVLSLALISKHEVRSDNTRAMLQHQRRARECIIIS